LGGKQREGNGKGVRRMEVKRGRKGGKGDMREREGRSMPIGN